MNRICLTPQQAIQFSQLPIIVDGDAKLIDLAFQIKSDTNPNAYAYHSVEVCGREGPVEIRIRVSKEIDQ